MSDTDQSNPLDDELLSAYVDGQLTEAERTAVEARLQHDAGARQLVAELRTMSSLFQTLPAESLGEDLRERVFQLAEREMLVGAEPAAAWAAQQPARSVPRRWLYAGAAIAAALLLTVFLPSTEEEQRPVAQVNPRQDQTTQPATEKLDTEKGLQENTTMNVDDNTEEKRRAIADAPQMRAAEGESLSEAAPTPRERSGAGSPLSAAGPRPAGQSYALRSATPQAAVSADSAQPLTAPASVEIHLTLAEPATGRAELLRLFEQHKLSLPAQREAAVGAATTARSRSRAIQDYGNGARRRSPENRLETQASPAQVEALLTALQVDRRDFTALSIEGSPRDKLSPLVRHWQRRLSMLQQAAGKQREESAADRVESEIESDLADEDYAPPPSLRLVLVLHPAEDPAPAAAAPAAAAPAKRGE